ncbi:MAG: hypothetical protein JW762_12685 [Dehalococcoidales bacterium]|nr:hypothetical protein [Dehalococcoidales bacterium]
MKIISDFDFEKKRILNVIKEVFSVFKTASQVKSVTLDNGIKILGSVRNLVYEELNQLQHESLILKAIEILQERYLGIIDTWYWNPRQTGTIDEPDLRGVKANGDIILSAEVTTSIKPQGAIDTRLTNTLKKLSVMPGEKYFIVTTKAMENSAITKVSKSNYPINVLCIE